MLATGVGATRVLDMIGHIQHELFMLNKTIKASSPLHTIALIRFFVALSWPINRLYSFGHDTI